MWINITAFKQYLILIIQTIIISNYLIFLRNGVNIKSLTCILKNVQSSALDFESINVVGNKLMNHKEVEYGKINKFSICTQHIYGRTIGVDRTAIL